MNAEKDEFFHQCQKGKNVGFMSVAVTLENVCAFSNWTAEVKWNKRRGEIEKWGRVTLQAVDEWGNCS